MQWSCSSCFDGSSRHTCCETGISSNRFVRVRSTHYALTLKGRFPIPAASNSGVSGDRAGAATSTTVSFWVVLSYLGVVTELG